MGVLMVNVAAMYCTPSTSVCVCSQVCCYGTECVVLMVSKALVSLSEMEISSVLA